MRSPAPTAPTELPRWKKGLFAVVTVLGFFALLEGSLWLLGVRPVLATRDPFVGFAPLPLYVETSDADGQIWMATAENKLAHFNSQQFLKPKPSGTYRIFCLGGSTTYGHPYEDSVSFAGWLRELLPQVEPDVRWEVINAGGISYASYRVALVMEELSQYEPDLFIVYSGHNEFLEERAYGDLRQASAARLRMTSALAQTRTFALIERIVHSPAIPPGASLPDEVDAVLDHTVGPESYQRDDSQRANILTHYEFNLLRMIGMARSVGAALILVTPAANAKDCSPFKSQHSPGLSPAQRQQFSQHLERGKQLEQAGDLATALNEYQAAVQLDPRFAEIHFRLGHVLLALDRRGEASAAFRQALDEDVCPVRAPSEISEIVRRVGRELQVPVVDYVALLQNETLRTRGHNVLGCEHFLDHVHLSLDATRLLSVALVHELGRAGHLAGEAALREDQIASATERIISRIDPVAQAVSLRTLAKVLNWAGKHAEAGPLALEALETLPDDPESLVIGGAYLKAQGDPERAITHYRRALQNAPGYVEAHRLLGAALVETGQLEAALASFRQLTELTPADAHAWHMTGAVLAALQRDAEALGPYETALAIAPDDPHLHYNLGRSLARLNRIAAAIVHLERALILNPSDTDALRELRALQAGNSPGTTGS